MQEKRRDISNDGSTEHLKGEIPRTMQELEELKDIADVVASKIQRRNDYIKRHMMQCGTCLSNMITAGSLVDIRDHWDSEGSFGFRAGMS
jgi:hypothetical protein